MNNSPTPITIEQDMAQFESNPSNAALGDHLAHVFVDGCRDGHVATVSLMLDFMVRQQKSLLYGAAKALDMGMAFAAHMGRREVLDVLWPTLDRRAQAECLYDLLDGGHSHLFLQFFDPALIDPEIRQGKRILSQAAIRQDDDIMRVLIKLFPPFDAQKMMEWLGEPDDWVTRQAIGFLNAHQKQHQMEEELRLATFGKGATGLSKKM